MHVIVFIMHIINLYPILSTTFMMENHTYEKFGEDKLLFPGKLLWRGKRNLVYVCPARRISGQYRPAGHVFLVNHFWQDIAYRWTKFTASSAFKICFFFQMCL